MASAPILLTAARLGRGKAASAAAGPALAVLVARRHFGAAAAVAAAPEAAPPPPSPRPAPAPAPAPAQAAPARKRQIHPAARNILLGLCGLKRRQTTRFGPPKPSLAGGGGGYSGGGRNTLAFGQAFGGRPPNGAPVRKSNGLANGQRANGANGLNGHASSLVQGRGGRGGPPSLLQGRPSPGLAQGRPRPPPAPAPSLIQGPRRQSVDATVNGSRGVNGHKLNGAGGSAYTTSLDDPADDDGGGGGGNKKDEPRTYESDLVVVLDMDECLIHSQFLSHQQSSCRLSAPLEDKYRQAEAGRPGGSPAFNADEEAESIVSSNCEYFRIHLPDGDLVHVNKRPRLDDFLAEICSRYETHVFTAAVDMYADPLLDRLDPDGGMFAKRFFRESCTLDSDLGAYVKDLHALLGGRDPWGRGARSVTEPHVNGHAGGPDPDAARELFEKYNEGRVVLVDNNPLSFLAQPSNGILVSNFYDDPKDATLEAVSELLDELDKADDVRPVLDERFGLAEALGDVLKYSGGGWR